MSKKSSFVSRLFSYIEKYWWIAVIIAVVITYAIIMLLAQGQSVWFDEGYSILLAKKPVYDLLALTSVDAHPPFYYLLLKAWASIFGWSEFALRSFSAVTAATTVGLVLILVRNLFAKKVMLVTIPFVVLAPFFLRYGYEIRMYALVGLIGVLATFVLVKAVNSTQKKWWGIYALLVAFGMYTLYMSIVIWLAHLTWLIIKTRDSGKFYKRPWFVAYIGAIIVFAPYIPTAFHQLTHSALPGIGNVLTIDGLSGVLSLMFSYIPSWQIGGVLSIVLLTLVALGIYLTGHILRSLSRENRQNMYLILFCFFVPLIFYILISLLPKPFFIPRYLAHVVIYFYILLGLIVALGWQYGKRVTAILFGGLSLTLLILGVFQLYSTGNFNLERLQAPHTIALRQVVSCDSSTIIVADDPYTYIDSVYYFSGCNIRFYAKDNVDFAGGYAPLHDSSQRVANPSLIDSKFLYVLHWIGGKQSFIPDSRYKLMSSTTFDKQVIDRYELQQ